MRSPQVFVVLAGLLQSATLSRAAPHFDEVAVDQLLGSSSHQRVLVADSSQSQHSPVDARETYGGQQVWRFDISRLSRKEKDAFFGQAQALGLDVWKAASTYTDIRLDAEGMEALLDQIDLPARLMIPSVQSLVDASQPPAVSSSSSPGAVSATVEQYPTDSILSPFHDAYHGVEEMYTFLDDLSRDFDGQQGIEVETFTVGDSAEGQAIKGIRARMGEDRNLTDSGIDAASKKGKKHPKKPKKPSGPPILRELVLQSGQHAREWVGPATAIYYIHSLLLAARADTSSEAARLLRSFTFTIVPTINPDGYTYSREHSRMWRKNRQDLGEKCQGIDLNSNWGYKWRSPHGPSPCSDAYPGKEAFEAVEARVMANYLANGSSLTGDFLSSPDSRPVQRKVRSFIDLHSYGQLFMFPFAHSCDDFPPDAEMLMEAGLGVAKAMRSIHGETYQSGQACDLTYRAPGDAIDYAYGVTDIRWSYSAELRDTGTYGFMLPPSLIRSAAEETTAGLLYLGKFIYNLEIAG